MNFKATLLAAWGVGVAACQSPTDGAGPDTPPAESSPVASAGNDAATGSSAAPEQSPLSFERQVLSSQFVAEGAALCDVDRDGHVDVVAGADWYAGPKWTRAQPFRPHQVYDPVNYSDAFSTFCHDFDADGWLDILIMGFPGLDASWFVNPQTEDGEWVRHLAFEPLDNEAVTFADLTGDGAPEIVLNSGGYFGWASADATDPTRPFLFHPLSVQGSWSRFTHGLGIGDLDADGRQDVLDAQGAWLAPTALQGDPVWSRLPAAFGEGGAQMFAYDVDGDADQDVITSLQAHGYGIAWYERTNDASFVQHVISGTPDAPGPAAIALHEPHALLLVDLDGDGLQDILTGERFWGHAPANEADRDLAAPARLVWFRLTRDAVSVQYTAHTIDTQSGVGVQVAAAPLEDGRMAIVVANKKGVFGFRAQATTSNQAGSP